MEPMTALGNATTSPTREPDTKRTAHSRWAERYFGWLLAAPGMLVILALSIYPLIYSVWVAFVNYDFRGCGFPTAPAMPAPTPGDL